MRLVYLDNAATSFPKPKNVINAVNDSLFRCGNPGRSGHELSIYSAREVYSCREVICRFFNFNHPENVVFTYNTTYALNMAIKGLCKDNCEIIVSNLEHNSVLRPVSHLALEKQNVSIKFFDALGTDDEIIENIQKLITEKTRLCAMTMCSNVTGKILPYKRISQLCKKHGIKLVLDAAQCAGLVRIDLSKLYFSAVCFAGHKSLCGIMGTGFVIFSPSEIPQTYIEGGNGTMSSSLVQSGPLPERLEAGTLGVPGIIALREGIRHITATGIDRIYEKCMFLESELTEGLCNIKRVRVYGMTDRKVSTVLFNVEGKASEETAELLARNGICTRAGLHCAPLAHKALGTLEMGAVRASISHFNCGSDIDALVSAVKRISCGI